MRNLLEYPVTHEEKVAALRSAIARVLAEGGVGDIEPVALAEVLEDLERIEAEMRTIEVGRSKEL